LHARSACCLAKTGKSGLLGLMRTYSSLKLVKLVGAKQPTENVLAGII
jgi:hypothetical protein